MNKQRHKNLELVNSQSRILTKSEGALKAILSSKYVTAYSVDCKAFDNGLWTSEMPSPCY